METLSLLVAPTLGMKRKDRLNYMKPFKMLLLLLLLLITASAQAQVKHKKGLKQTEREISKKFDASERLLGNFDKDRSSKTKQFIEYRQTAFVSDLTKF